MTTIALRLVVATREVEIQPTGWLGNAFAAFRAAIEGARFDGQTRRNYLPLAKAPGCLARLVQAGFALDISPGLREALAALESEQTRLASAADGRLEAAEALMAARGLSLYAFQRSGVKWLATRTGALLSDEMGLGKTIQALTALPEGNGVVVVCPAVAKGVWAREAAKWRPDFKVTLLSGRGNFRWPTAGEMVIVNYDILSTPEGAPLPGTSVIADEAHALKNFKAQRTVRFRALSDAVRANGGRTWLLTATPLLNRPSELWAILSAAGLERDTFGSYKQFVELFEGRKDHWGGMRWGTPHASVPERMARVSLRRLRVEVLPDLPVKTWRTHEVEPTREALAACRLLEEILDARGLTVTDVETELAKRDPTLFEGLSRARALLAMAKIPALLQLVTEFEEQGEPLVVFSAHRGPVDHFATREGWRIITGDTKPEERTEIEDAFQRGELKGVACTVKAGGVAITLTRACHALFVDRDWTPALNSQAEDRICRIGQDRGCVITNLVFAHPVDRRVEALLTIKTTLVNASLPKEETMPDQVEAVQLGEILRAAEAVEEEAKASAKALPLRFHPSSPVQVWAMGALVQLSSNDPDRALEVNGVGFNRMDGAIGHSLAEQALAKGLTEKQWNLAIQLCKKYHRQVGECPK